MVQCSDTAKSPAPDAKHRPPAIAVPGDRTGDAEESSSSSAAGGTATETPHWDSMTALDAFGIDAFALYQRFRLQMVKTFGSLASALYELGADHETGEIRREDFEAVVCNRLHFFTAAEANTLFTHATNADPMDHGLGGKATFRDFSIAEDEWRMVVKRKNELKQGGKGAMPFESGPSGASLGIFHRAVHVGDIKVPGSGTATPNPASPKVQDQSISDELPPSQVCKGLLSPEAKRAQSARMHQCKQPRGGVPGARRVYAWQQPQKPWAPSLFASTAETPVLNEARTKAPSFCRGRPNEQWFYATAPAPFIQQPKWSQLDLPDRPLCSSESPSRREEAAERPCVRQVAEWWPYMRQPPPLKLPILRRRPTTTPAACSNTAGSASSRPRPRR